MTDPDAKARLLPYGAGDRIGSKYEIRRVIGEGGMGVVYEAMHLRLRTRVAIKMLFDEAIAPDAAARFEREARAAAQLHGMNAVKVLDIEVAEGRPYMVLELLSGLDLADALHERGPLPFMEAADYVQQTADAMAEAHTLGIVHRDLKPGNLFLCKLRNTDRRLVKVLDFGISKMIHAEEALTESFSTFGTAGYMSPEQIRDTKTVDGRSDIWALGVILYESVTGRLPFEGSTTNVIASIVADPIPSPSLYRPGLPPALEQVILKALEKDRSARYQTAQELSDAIAPFAPSERIVDITSVRGRVSDPPIGRALVDAGEISAADLLAALRKQRERPSERLGQILIGMGLCSEEAVLRALAAQQSSQGTARDVAPFAKTERAMTASSVPPARTSSKGRTAAIIATVAAVAVVVPLVVRALIAPPTSVSPTEAKLLQADAPLTAAVAPEVAVSTVVAEAPAAKASEGAPAPSGALGLAVTTVPVPSAATSASRPQPARPQPAPPPLGSPPKATTPVPPSPKNPSRL